MELNVENHNPLKRLELLDYGRLFAAIAVMLYHITFSGFRQAKIIAPFDMLAIAGISKGAIILA